MGKEAQIMSLHEHEWKFLLDFISEDETKIYVFRCKCGTETQTEYPIQDIFFGTEEATPYANGLIKEFLEDLDKLPTEHVTWVEEHKIRKSKFGEMNTIQSSMIFLPEITGLKMKWEKRLNSSDKTDGGQD